MELQRAAGWAQILSIIPGAYCAYAAWATLHPQPAQAQPTSDSTGIVEGVKSLLSVNATGVLIAFGAFIALLTLGIVLAVASRIRLTPILVKPDEDKPDLNQRIAYFERKLDQGDFYVKTYQSDREEANVGQVLWRDVQLKAANLRGDRMLSPADLAKAHEVAVRELSAVHRAGQMAAVEPLKIKQFLSGDTRPIILEWLPAHGDTPQALHIRITNVGPTAFRDFRLHISEVLRLQESSGQFVQMAELHSGGTFVELQMPGRRELFPDQPVVYEFLRLRDTGQLHFQGQLKGQGTQVRNILTRGVYRVAFRAKYDGERSESWEMCFQWFADQPPNGVRCP